MALPIRVFPHPNGSISVLVACAHSTGVHKIVLITIYLNPSNIGCVRQFDAFHALLPLVSVPTLCGTLSHTVFPWLIRIKLPQVTEQIKSKFLRDWSRCASVRVCISVNSATENRPTTVFISSSAGTFSLTGTPYFDKEKSAIFLKDIQIEELKFTNIDISPYPNSLGKKIYRAVMDEEYYSPSVKFVGKKELFLEVANNKVQILTED